MGLAVRRLCSVGKDDIFGEDLTGTVIDHEVDNSGAAGMGKSNYCVRALSYCDMHKVMVADFNDILALYPEFAGDFLLNFRVTFNLRFVSRSMLLGF